MTAAVAAMKDAFADFSSGRATVPQRTAMDLDAPGGFLLVKPALQPGSALGAKLLSYLPTNPARGVPLIHALVLLMDPETGAPTAICEGGFLTAWRTGAASGAATDLLARPDASRLAILGAGAQARTQLLAVAAVRELERVRVFSPTEANRDDFAVEMSAETGIPVFPVDSPAAAVADADIICAATTATDPVFEGAAVGAGTHVNGVGSFRPEMRELDLELIRKSRMFVDSRAAAAVEAGELIDAERRGGSRREDWTELGELIEGSRPGRSNSDEITLFKSVGLAVQDVAAGALAVTRARELGIGTEVDL